MVELFCELLLARAGVLDQLAFGERGIEMRRGLSGQGRGQGRGQGGSVQAGGQGQRGKGLFGFSWFGSRQSSEAAAAAAGATPPTDAEAKPDDPNKSNDEPPCYLDPPIDEAAIAIFYAWPRFPHDVRELTMLRTLLAERYGKEISALAVENRADVKVPERLVKSLRVRAPSQELVESYLREIARAYGVRWGGEGGDGEDGGLGSAPSGFDGDGDKGGGAAITGTDDDTTVGDKSNITVNPEQQTGLDVSSPADAGDQSKPSVSASGPIPAPQRSVPGGIPEVDELTRRFAALRR